MGLRGKGGGGGGGAGGGANIRTIILGVITIVIALIMLGIAMDVVTDLLSDVNIVWDDYPGAEAMLGLFPLLMMIALVLFGGIMIWIGYGGGDLGIKGTILTTIVVVVAIILLPIVIDAVDTLMARPDIGDYTGLEAFLGLIPLLYVIGTLFITGMLAYRGVRGHVPAIG